MKYWFLLLLFLVMPTQSAELGVYRSVDKQGNVSFSDQPSTDSEQVDLQISPSYTPVAIPDTVEKSDDQDVVLPEYSVQIVSPEYDENFWGTGGTAKVSVNIRPRLNVGRGDQIIYRLDGVDVGEPSLSTSITVTNVERGSHTLVASVIDKNGDVLKNSKSVLFHMHQQTAIRKSPK